MEKINALRNLIRDTKLLMTVNDTPELKTKLEYLQKKLKECYEAK